VAKAARVHKRLRGQFLTPDDLAARIVATMPLRVSDLVCEPGFGDGSFLLPLIERFMAMREGTDQERLTAVLSENVVGAEIDPEMHNQCLMRIAARWGALPAHSLILGDYLAPETLAEHAGQITWVVGNPPFGASLDPIIEDWLDRRYGMRMGRKIKKESYAFFIIKSLDLLSADGHLLFICSDTFLSISTMAGLRAYLRACGDTNVESLSEFSAETSQPMILLRHNKKAESGGVRILGKELSADLLALTAGGSWLIDDSYAPYFHGPKIGDYMVATSGMTTGRNEYFVREVRNGALDELYDFEFYERPITVAGEVARARLGHVAPRRLAEIAMSENNGATQRCVEAHRREVPKHVALPHSDYRYYNKACGSMIYAPPSHAIFWRDGGDAVLSYKRAGNWYLHGVGGGPFFEREGITWQLISSRLNVRYLPSGYILDSGAPCAFLRPGVAEDELYFILGWTTTSLCTRILKDVINHTRNIQSKDFERLPYPFWVSSDDKAKAIGMVRDMVRQGIGGRRFRLGDGDIGELGSLYAYADESLPG
jgi:hypothetical protein